MNGLEVLPIYFSGGNRLMQAPIADDIQIRVPGGITSARATICDADITSVAGHINKLTYTLYTSKEITKAEQLKGQARGNSRPNSPTHVLSALVMRKVGLENAVTLRPFGDSRHCGSPDRNKMIARMVTIRWLPKTHRAP